jgi:hypothetical protein
VHTLTLPLIDRFYGPGAYPSLFPFPGCVAPNPQQAVQAPGLLNCSALGVVVQSCQAAGKKVLLSLKADGLGTVGGNSEFGDPNGGKEPFGPRFGSKGLEKRQEFPKLHLPGINLGHGPVVASSTQSSSVAAIQPRPLASLVPDLLSGLKLPFFNGQAPQAGTTPVKSSSAATTSTKSSSAATTTVKSTLVSVFVPRPLESLVPDVLSALKVPEVLSALKIPEISLNVINPTPIAISEPRPLVSLVPDVLSALKVPEVLSALKVPELSLDLNLPTPASIPEPRPLESLVPDVLSALKVPEVLSALKVPEVSLDINLPTPASIPEPRPLASLVPDVLSALNVPEGVSNKTNSTPIVVVAPIPLNSVVPDLLSALKLDDPKAATNPNKTTPIVVVEPRPLTSLIPDVLSALHLYNPKADVPEFPNLFDKSHSPSALALTLFSLFGEGHTERADLRPLGPDVPSGASPISLKGVDWINPILTALQRPLGEEVVVDGFDIQLPAEWKGTYQDERFKALVKRLKVLQNEAWTRSGQVKGGSADLGADGKSVVYFGWVGGPLKVRSAGLKVHADIKREGWREWNGEN